MLWLHKNIVILNWVEQYVKSINESKIILKTQTFEKEYKKRVVFLNDILKENNIYHIKIESDTNGLFYIEDIPF